MNNQEANNLARLRYGFKAKIFKNSIFSEAAIYLDTLYDNFLWITTDGNAFLVDLCFTTISSYSLHLELQIKHESGFEGQHLPRYILLKELNTQVSIIFGEYQTVGNSSEQSMGNFVQGRKPKIFNTIQNYLQQKRASCNYSANFSRCFKKMRLQLQLVQTQNATQFSVAQLIHVLHQIDDFSSIDKTHLAQIKQNLSLKQVLQILKILYCKLNLPLLKSLKGGENINFFKKLNSFVQQAIINLGANEVLTCFEALTKLQNTEQNYVIPQFKVDEQLPLVDYFCFSSHNTYLTGNQLTSDCKVTRYIEDLNKGIKCVELDVHNKGDNEPIITHAVQGKGFCTPITFRHTIEAIDEFLQYHPNHYPIILSIQNHAHRQNQDLMNNILRKEFPKNILTPQGKGQFYKLSQTKGKIIVKNSCSIQSLTQFRNNSQIPKVKSYDFGNNNSFVLKQTPHISSILNKSSMETIATNGVNGVSQSLLDVPQSQNENYRAFLEKINKYKRLKMVFNQKIDQNSYLPVQKIVQITCLFKTSKGIETLNPNPFECSSMQNTKIVKSQKQSIVTYTKKAWLRSYPEGTEIYSNNYDFLQLLARGVQIIALNTQTNDDFAIMMNSYFRAGRKGTMENIGYIQKPQYLRNNNLARNTSAVYPSQRNFEFIFYTHHQLQFTLYSIDKSKLLETKLSERQIRVAFTLGQYNQSFLIIKINRKFVECLPLRFLSYEAKGQKLYKNIIGRDYEFQNTGVTILTSFKWT